MLDKKTMKKTGVINGFALRGAIGFGSGNLIAYLVIILAVLLSLEAVLFLGFVIGGTIGGGFLCWGRKDIKSSLIVAIGFGLGFIIVSVIIPFSILSLNTAVSVTSVVWNAGSWGIAFGVAGAIGAIFFCLGVKEITDFYSVVYIVITGAIGFCISGTIGGAIAFVLFDIMNTFIKLRMEIAFGLAFFIGLLIAHVAGGALFGMGIDSTKKIIIDSRNQYQIKESPSVERSGLAVFATIIGLFGIIFAAIFPFRFRLPHDFVFMTTIELLGVSEIIKQAAVFLLLVGLPPLVVGVVALVRIKKSQGKLFGISWALGGVIIGLIITMFSLLVFVSPISRYFEVKYANALLESVQGQEGNWNYGNVIYDANIILGRVALKENNIQKAKHYLLEAGKTPGSPQLNSFGPSMGLAKELLKKGEREVVIEFFQLCAKFWEMGRNRLNDWTTMVKQGVIPDFNKGKK